MDTKKILVYIRDSCIKRNNRGLLGLAAAFRKLDQDFSNGIQFEEFRKGFEELGINLPKGDLNRVFQVFDKDNSGTIDFKEFIDALKPPLPESRRRVVDLAFDKLDYNKDGVLQVEDLKVTYRRNAMGHPDYVQGRKTLEEVLAMFLLHFDDPERPDGMVTRDEFRNYYSGVSVTYNDDCYFDMMMRTMWDLPGKNVTYNP